MKINKQLLGEFFYDIYSTDDLEERFKIYEKYVQTLGFDGVSYTFIPEFCLEKNSKQAPTFIFSELFPESFIEQYSYDRFDKNDFTVKRIKAKKLEPMDWKIFKHSDELSLEEKNVIVVADNDHEIKNAISVPTMSNDKGIAGASFVSTANSADFQQLKNERLEMLQLFTKLFHDSTVNHSVPSLISTFVMPTFLSLNQKEIAVLRYLASGKYLKNIKYSTDISYSYASNLLSSLRKKLGGISNEKMMYLIGLFNMMDHL